MCQRKTGGRSNQDEHDNNNSDRTPDTDSKWIKNLLDTPLTEAQTRLLAHGPNFSIIPKNLPKEEYVASIEHACQKLQEGEVQELRVEIKNLLKNTKDTKSNITKKEFKAIKELKQDKKE